MEEIMNDVRLIMKGSWEEFNCIQEHKGSNLLEGKTGFLIITSMLYCVLVAVIPCFHGVMKAVNASESGSESLLYVSIPINRMMMAIMLATSAANPSAPK
jgi:hypothetical protein